MQSITLSHPQIVSIAVNVAIFVLIAIGSIVFISQLKLKEKGYKYLFVLYVIYWVPIMLVRPYRGTMQHALGDVELMWVVLAAYGFVGIFLRAFADVISYVFKFRKAFLYFSLVVQIILFIPVIAHPSTATNIVEAFGIGVGASCIGTYELLFKEQYGKKRAFLTVSLLSIPPLLANFLTAPIQSVVKTAATSHGKTDPHILLILWMIALAFCVLALIMMFFLKEKRRTTPGLFNAIEEQLSEKKNNRSQELGFFFGLAFVGMLIMFIKFSNSGSIGTMHVEQLAKYNHTSSAAYEGYLSVIFSLFQLVAGILVGTVLIKKWNTLSIFLLGSGIWVIYELAAAFIRSPIAYFCVHSLNGFAYGILYNLILAVVLKISTSGKVVTKMGGYQSILAIGITGAGWFIPWVKHRLMASNHSFNSYMHTYMVENLILFGCVLLAIVTFVLLTYFFDRDNASFKFKQPKAVESAQPLEAKKEEVLVSEKI
ncbi:MFS transporter [Ureaplasma ceti]|uniref:MFS transporter n=1 Tax=Ureaplasma ceti TaxID=3119530 RepID=A0ABP9U910_9BACT